MEDLMQIKLLGVRGTVPVHGEDFSQFGGATSCVLVKAGGECIILDAGTGLQLQSFRAFFPGKCFSMLITHAHVDHLMGFPIFPPFFDSGCRCDVYLKTREGRSGTAQIEALMAPPLWPIRTDSLKARVNICDVEPSFQIGRVQVDTMESNHPGGSTIYKLSYGGRSVVYATDYEPESDFPADFCSFAKDCSLLLLDAQYTQEEYPHTKGFGHSTIERSAALAEHCRAARTILVHHDPKRTDRQLLMLEQEVRRRYPQIHFGREGEEVFL